MLVRPYLKAHLQALALVVAVTSCGRGGDGSATSADAAPAPVGEVETTVEVALHDRCARSVGHVARLIRGEVEDDTISPREAAIIAAVEAMSVASCEREGLTPAQEECVLAARGGQDLAAVGGCPAIAERKPSWLRLPPTEAEQEALRQAFAKQLQEQAREKGQDSPLSVTPEDSAQDSPAD